MRKLFNILSLCILSLFSSCWEKQDIGTNPPSHPYYTLSGIVSYEETELPVVGAEVSVTMTELYQGDFLDSIGTVTNTDGFYAIQGLYRGRYDILVMSSEGDTLYLSEVGIIKYEDRTYDILIQPSDSTSWD